MEPPPFLWLALLPAMESTEHAVFRGPSMELSRTDTRFESAQRELFSCLHIQACVSGPLSCLGNDPVVPFLGSLPATPNTPSPELVSPLH